MVKYTRRGLVVKRPGVLSKVQMLNLVLGVGVFSLLPKIFVRTESGAGNGCVNFMDAWKNAFFLQEKPMSLKFLVLGGVGIWGCFWGGGSADFIFMCARIFLTFRCC